MTTQARRAAAQALVAGDKGLLAKDPNQERVGDVVQQMLLQRARRAQAAGRGTCATSAAPPRG